MLIISPNYWAVKTKYVVMSREQNAGRNHSAKIDNSTFERV